MLTIVPEKQPTIRWITKYPRTASTCCKKFDLGNLFGEVAFFVLLILGLAPICPNFPRRGGGGRDEIRDSNRLTKLLCLFRTYLST